MSNRAEIYKAKEIINFKISKGQTFESATLDVKIFVLNRQIKQFEINCSNKSASSFGIRTNKIKNSSLERSKFQRNLINNPLSYSHDVTLKGRDSQIRVSCWRHEGLR